MSLLFGSLFAAKVDFDMGLGMMRMFCFTHVYMIPLWMIVFTWGNAGGSCAFFLSVFFFSFLPRSFMGGLVFSLFFRRLLFKCRAINYSFFHHWALDF